MQQYKHPNIQKQSIKGKGTGYVANSNIPARTVIIRELPAFKIPDDEKVVCEMLQLLYHIFTCPDRERMKKFKELHPETLEGFKVGWDDVHGRLQKLEKVYPKKAKYLREIDRNKLMLACAKYSCNAFDFGTSPVILFQGTKLNHSCLPNSIFGKVGDHMVFETVREIKKGEEISDNYIPITRSRGERIRQLKSQYGFLCACERCSGKKDRFCGEAKKIDAMTVQT